MAEMKNLDIDTATHGPTTVAHGDLEISNGYQGQLLGNHSDSDVSDGEFSLEVKDTNLFHNELDSAQQAQLREDDLLEPMVRSIVFIFTRITIFVRILDTMLNSIVIRGG